MKTNKLVDNAVTVVFGWFRPLVDSLITERLVAFYVSMVKKGQISEIPTSGPTVR